jgi:hypothetical protein
VVSASRIAAISLPVLAGILMAGCSNEQVYNAIQENQRLECAKLPDARYEECMRELNTSYREYNKSMEN